MGEALLPGKGVRLAAAKKAVEGGRSGPPAGSAPANAEPAVQAKPEAGRVRERRQPSVSRELALWLLLMRTARVIARARERELIDGSVSAQGFAVLLTILRQGPRATPASISRETILERNTISQQLTRMEKDGLVNRVKDLERKNQVRIEVTEKGYRGFLQAGRRPITGTIMSVLSKEEHEALWEILAKLRSEALAELGVSAKAAYPPARLPGIEGKAGRARIRPVSRPVSRVSKEVKLVDRSRP
jgi:DNA-binding MarR family transcriptional regulator